MTVVSPDDPRRSSAERLAETLKKIRENERRAARICKELMASSAYFHLPQVDDTVEQLRVYRKSLAASGRISRIIDEALAGGDRNLRLFVDDKLMRAARFRKVTHDLPGGRVLTVWAQVEDSLPGSRRSTHGTQPVSSRETGCENRVYRCLSSFLRKAGLLWVRRQVGKRPSRPEDAGQSLQAADLAYLLTQPSSGKGSGSTGSASATALWFSMGLLTLPMVKMAGRVWQRTRSATPGDVAC